MSGLASAHSMEKLRSTCNQCALSKVRCNKRKPTCQRCETHDFECVYDRSRRRGKPRSSQQQRALNGHSTPYSAQNGPYDWPDSSYSAVGMDAFSKFSSNLLPGDDTFDCSLWADPNNMFYGAHSDSTREDSSSGEMTVDKGSSVGQDQRPSQACDSSVFMTFAPLDKPCQGETCTSTAFCTLGTLYSISTAAGRRIDATQDASQVSSGHLLQTNRTTMDRLMTLLKNDCQHCAQHVDLGVLLSTAVAKMLSWYRAVLDSMTDACAENDSPSRASVSMTPIMLGDFQLDPTTETRMKAQLLLCELQNMSPLLNLLSERNSRVAGGGDVYISLDKQLRASLAELTSEIKNLVVRGSKPSTDSRQQCSASQPYATPFSTRQD